MPKYQHSLESLHSYKLFIRLLLCVAACPYYHPSSHGRRRRFPDRQERRVVAVWCLTSAVVPFAVEERLAATEERTVDRRRSGRPPPKSVPPAAEERAFLCRRGYRPPLQSGLFAVVERAVRSRRAGRSLRPARRPPSSCASMPHEYRRNGRASIYHFLSMFRLSVVCSITTSLPFPLLLLTLVKNVPFYHHTHILPFHVADSHMPFTWHPGAHPGLHETSVYTLLHRDLLAEIITRASNLFLFSFYATSSPVTVSWSSPPRKTP